MQKAVFILVACLFCLSLTAGVADGFYHDPAFELNSILPQNSFEMHHSLTFSSALSSNGDGMYSNMYTNHLDFALSKNIDLKMKLHFINAGSLSFDRDYDFNLNDDNASQLLPEFQMEWRPSENTTIMLHFQQSNRYYNCFNRFWSNDLRDED